jgi:dsDNA-specific endonuclease/ATPase MutS2
MKDARLPENPDEPVVLPIEDWIDLHSFQPGDVASVVEEYLYQAWQRGFVQVRIIHGRGIGVQREIVHSLLRRHPRVHSFCDAPDRGATIVALLQPKHVAL